MIPIEKGDQLERAVEEIESLIIENSSFSKAQSIEIERKKRIYEKGIQLHEIDFYINIDFGYQNKYIYIIECKNLDRKSVSKTQIIDFQAKIKYVGAAKGFVIGKRFSPAAIFIANSDPYIELLRVNSSEYSGIIHAPLLGKLFRDSKSVRITKICLTYYDKSSEIIKSVNNFLNTKLSNDDTTIYFKDLIIDLINQDIPRLKENNRNKIISLDCGTITLNNIIDLFIKEKQLTINDKAVSLVEINYEFDVDVFKPKIISKFDVEKKGRNVYYELIHPEKKGYMDFTTVQNIDEHDKWDINLRFRIE